MSQTPRDDQTEWDRPWPWLAVAVVWVCAATVLLGVAWVLRPNPGPGYGEVVAMVMSAAAVSTWLILRT